MKKTLDDFLKSNSHIPDTIGETPVPPAPVDPGMPPLDPMKPWRSINVEPYLPLARMGIKAPTTLLSKVTKEPFWEIDDFELATLPLEEACQKLLYDLRLSRFADNPYVALLTSLGALMGAKYMALKAIKALEEMERQKRQRENGAPRRERGPKPEQQRSGSNVQPFPGNPMAPQNQPSTPPVSLVVNGRMQEYVGESSSVVSPEAASLFYSPSESDELDE